MPNTWIADQINTLFSGYLGGTATAGVAGGPLQVRSSELRGILKVHRFTVEQATPNPLPNNPAGAVATGDVFWLALLDPTERIFLGQIFFNAWGGTAPTISIGKVDLNNSANNDAVHYLAATNITSAGNSFLNANMTEQVGADPLGDQTTGNLIPAFGSNKVVVTGTLGGTLGSNGTITGYVLTVEEGN